jgi:hypothetical protein
VIGAIGRFEMDVIAIRVALSVASWEANALTRFICCRRAEELDGSSPGSARRGAGGAGSGDCGDRHREAQGKSEGEGEKTGRFLP